MTSSIDEAFGAKPIVIGRKDWCMSPSVLVGARDASSFECLAAREAGMDVNAPKELNMEALIEAIWGAKPIELPVVITPAMREKQNRDLAAALTAYLQQYLSEPPV